MRRTNSEIEGILKSRLQALSSNLCSSLESRTSALVLLSHICWNALHSFPAARDFSPSALERFVRIVTAATLSFTSQTGNADPVRGQQCPEPVSARYTCSSWTFCTRLTGCGDTVAIFRARPVLLKAGVQVQREEVPHYAEGSQFLKSRGFRNASEISRVLDIAMNPNSLYLKDRHKRRSVNSSVSAHGAHLLIATIS